MSHKIGDYVVVRSPGIILTAKIEELALAHDCVRVRVESPWGKPFPFTEWMRASDLGLREQ